MDMKIGIDVGSTGIKIVFVNIGTLVWKKVVPTRPGQQAIVRELIQQGLAACHLTQDNIDETCVTGYGRNLIETPDTIIDEISANAAGLHHLSGGKARTVINIGGQDVKIIKIDPHGRVLDFRMNDKCAAGTGRFFEIAATILDTPLSDFHTPDSIDPVNINSTCAVFAESEIVSLMAKGVDKKSIIKGLNNAVARRIASLAGNGLLDEDIYVDGGPAKNKGLIQSLEDALLCDIHVVPEPQFSVAFGALFVA